MKYDALQILYSYGKTPIDLFLYDIEQDQSYDIFNSESETNGKFDYCSGAFWSTKYPDLFYYRLVKLDRSSVPEKDKKHTMLFFRYNTKENKVEE